MRRHNTKFPRPYYGWVVVAAGNVAILVGLGLGRFALGMILPSMSQALGLTPSQMGLISTSNFAGYLGAVGICLGLGPRMRPRGLITSALLLVAASMAMMAKATGFLQAALLYTLTGVGSGLTNIPTMALVPSWFRPSLRARAAGFIVMGSGFAMIMSGLAIPALNQAAQGWRHAWLLLAALTFAAALFCFVIIRNRPEEVGIQPMEDHVAPGNEGRAHGPMLAHVRPGRVIRLGALYFCFGASYVIYITFAVVAMIKEKGMTQWEAGYLWALIGLLSLFSGPVPGWVADRAGRRAALSLVFALQTAAYLLAGLPSAPTLATWASVVLFGLSAWSVPGIMTALVADAAGPRHTPRLFALVTLVLAAGQVIGPAAAGALAEATGSYSAGFFLASGATLAGMALSITMKAEE